MGHYLIIVLNFISLIYRIIEFIFQYHGCFNQIAHNISLILMTGPYKLVWEDSQHSRGQRSCVGSAL